MALSTLNAKEPEGEAQTDVLTSKGRGQENAGVRGFGYQHRTVFKDGGKEPETTDQFNKTVPSVFQPPPPDLQGGLAFQLLVIKQMIRNRFARSGPEQQA